MKKLWSDSRSSDPCVFHLVTFYDFQGVTQSYYYYYNFGVTIVFKYSVDETTFNKRI